MTVQYLQHHVIDFEKANHHLVLPDESKWKEPSPEERSSCLNFVKEKKVLLLIHGFNLGEDSIDTYIDNIKKTASNAFKKEYRVLIMKWPGYHDRVRYQDAKSSAKKAADYPWLNELVSTIMTTAMNVNVLAHSMGCYLFMRYMSKFPEHACNLRRVFFVGAALSKFHLEKEWFNTAMEALRGKLTMFYSKNDKVLSWIMGYGESIPHHLEAAFLPFAAAHALHQAFHKFKSEDLGSVYFSMKKQGRKSIPDICDVSTTVADHSAYYASSQVWDRLETKVHSKFYRSTAKEVHVSTALEVAREP
eukprot:TRINITY_DN43707_c0_g1_i1.p1 TRINITY_DN43707_c0_g1~~TRINITY_DN43707_c0_g1_i1.p1  ORF type:complete len:304 (-),score=74.15 TRINITY_DN43707_c0_g1_i1:135-1046(-)